MTTERCPDCGTKLNRVRKSLRTIAPEDGRRRQVTELSFFCPKCEETLDQVFWEDDPYAPCGVCYYRPACDAPPADCGAKNNFREFKTIVDTLPCGCPVGTHDDEIALDSVKRQFEHEVYDNLRRIAIDSGRDLTQLLGELVELVKESAKKTVDWDEHQ